MQIKVTRIIARSIIAVSLLVSGGCGEESHEDLTDEQNAEPEEAQAISSRKCDEKLSQPFTDDQSALTCRVEQNSVLKNVKIGELDVRGSELVFYTGTYGISGVKGKFAVDLWLDNGGGYSARYSVDGAEYFREWAHKSPGYGPQIDSIESMAVLVDLGYRDAQVEKIVRGKAQLFGNDAFLEAFQSGTMIAQNKADKDVCKISCIVAATAAGAVTAGAAGGGCFLLTRQAKACARGGTALGVVVGAWVQVKCDKKCDKMPAPTK